MGTTAGQFISTLTENHDIIVIGGLAVIAHGFNRPALDGDWRTCEAAPTIPDSAVTEIATGYLREFAADGDPLLASPAGQCAGPAGLTLF
jgi:hypothetical protein